MPICNDNTLLNLLQAFFAHFCVTFDVVDTPGVRRVVLHGPAGRDVVQYFPEMAPLALKCRFGASCTHTVEKGCAILAALEKGTVHPDRYESLMRIIAGK
jgi:ribosome biogenesis GTPase